MGTDTSIHLDQVHSNSFARIVQASNTAVGDGLVNVSSMMQCAGATHPQSPILTIDTNRARKMYPRVFQRTSEARRCLVAHTGTIDEAAVAQHGRMRRPLLVASVSNADHRYGRAAHRAPPTRARGPRTPGSGPSPLTLCSSNVHSAFAASAESLV